MNEDIRLSVNFFDHPKTIKLERRLGLRGIISLQRLWLWAAKNRPDGILSNMDDEDILIAAKWDGDGEFISTLFNLGWIDDTEGVYTLHDWTVHNDWAAGAENRSDKARFSRLARTNPEKYKELKDNGVSALTKEQYAEYTTVIRPHNERKENSDDRTTPAPAHTRAHTLVRDRVHDTREAFAPNDSKPNRSAQKIDPPKPSKPKIDFSFESGQFENISEEHERRWGEAYPAVDIGLNIKQAAAWLIANPKKRKQDYQRFLTHWFARCQEKGGNIPVSRASPKNNYDKAMEQAQFAAEIVRDAEVAI